jgi:hypothetical protein
MGRLFESANRIITPANKQVQREPMFSAFRITKPTKSVLQA